MKLDGESYREAVERLGLHDQERAAAFLGVSSRTLRNYAVDGMPMVLAMLLRLMIEKKTSVDEMYKMMKRKAAP